MSDIAEAGVLQGLVSDPSRLDEITFLKPYMFGNQVYRDIYTTYCTLKSEGREFGIQTVISRLAAAGNGNYTEKGLMQIFHDNLLEGAAGYEIQSNAIEVMNDYKKRASIAIVKQYSPDATMIDDAIQNLVDELAKLQELMVDDQGKTLAEITAEVKDNYFKPKDKPMIEFGIGDIDEAIGGIDGGDVVVIAARPGVGKSAFTLQALRHFSAQGKKTAYFNLEMMQEQVYERAVASASGLQMSVIRRNTRFHNDEQKKYLKGVDELLHETNIYVYEGKWSVSKIRAVQARQKFDAIVIDYLQLLTPDSNRAGNRAAEVGDISRGLKTIATDYKIPVFALSQLNRTSEMHKTKEPSMSELRESGAIEQDASVIIMLWQSNENNLDERGVKVEKARQGRTAKITMQFDGEHMMFDGFKPLPQHEFEDASDDDIKFD